MTKPIGKHIREEAAFICSVLASNPFGLLDAADMWGYPVADEDLTTDDERAISLAVDAFDAATEEDFRTVDEHWAAAESKLRTGWTP